MSDEELDDFELFEKLLGSKKDKYEFIEEIGSETLSRIYCAEDKETQTILILKVIEKIKLENGTKDALLKQIQTEISILELCKNKNENIIQLQDHFETDLSFVLIFENCETNLKKYLYNEGPLMDQDISIIKEIFLGVANGLSFLYDNQIIHRDLKPENIYIQEKDNKLIPKIAGFGIATFVSEKNYDLTGTLAYMAPEVLKTPSLGPYGPLLDMWSIGITFFEIFTGNLPYGDYISKKLLKKIFLEQNLYFRLTGNIQLNILFVRLLSIDQNKRMTIQELKEYVSSNDFLNEDIKFINNDKKNEDIFNDINKDIEKYNNSVQYDKNYIEECASSNLSREEQINNVVKITDLDDIQDIMSYCNGDLDNDNINNIIYYDENVKNDAFKNSIYGDCEEFERETNGAFILCTNITSLNYIMEEIKRENEKDKRIKFNLIVTGQSCDNVVIYLIENQYYYLIEKMCIFCMRREAHIDKKDFYDKIVDVYVEPRKVIDDFIKKLSSKENRPFVITKLLTLRDYQDKYHLRHEKIAKFYGEFDENLYTNAINNLTEYIKKDKHLKGGTIKNVKHSFEKFGKNKIVGDIQSFNEIIKEYTKDTLYKDLNKWLLSLNKNSYEYTAYFTGRLMYCLNSFALINKKYYNENKTIYRGMKLPYSCLQLYERAIGKIIILSNFTSTSMDEKAAQEFADRDEIETTFPRDLLFSVMIYIDNVWKENWLTSGMDIHEVSEYKNEQEVLYLPFSFYWVKDVKVDVEKKIADIYLRTCGKNEIIEEKIKMGKKIIIKKENNENIVSVVD